MRTHDDYTVGWVCALPLEMTAAIAMLDATHPPLLYPPTDQNAYTLGSIAGHNVVLTCLPSGIYGTISAATVVSQMASTFPQLQFGLMVGIGGGVPHTDHDIRLGDVVVSKPTGSCSGVVQYDYGKAIQGGRFEPTGMLNHPPRLLLTHMAQLQAQRLRQSEGVLYPTVLSALNQNASLQDGFSSPGPQDDVLFQSHYHHAQGNETCGECDRAQAVSRTARETMEPHVHYGIIASGDKVMKDSEARDRLAKDLGILCFEMEAAGLMNLLPSLVIRGICDYADSHKNKRWQGYAALTAAVYSKMLLSTFAPRTLRQFGKPKEMSAEERHCFNLLFQSDPEEDKNALKRRKGDRAPNTCNWLMETREIHRWLGLSMESSKFGMFLGTHGSKEVDESLKSNILWLYGNPGMGKSMMAIMLAEELPKLPKIAGKGSVAYFFCESGTGMRRTSLAILRGLLYQLIKNRPELIRFLFAKYEQRKEATFASFDTLWSVLVSIGADTDSGEKYCVIDALDECDQESQETLLLQIGQTFHAQNSEGASSLHVLITSRPYPELGRHLSQFPCQNLLNYTQVKSDLRTFIKSKVADLSTRNHYSKKVTEDITAIVEDKAEGTFLWVGIACSELTNVRSRDAVRTLQRLPRGLHSLYQKLLDTALTQNGDESRVVLHIVGLVAIAEEPLSVEELSIACGLYPDADTESRFRFTREDIEMCRLMVIVRDGIVRLLHKSVRDFLLRGDEDKACLVDKLTAHATLAYRCLDVGAHCIDVYRNRSLGVPKNSPDFMNILIERTNGQAVFLHYATGYWFHHIRHAKHEFRVLPRHEKLFRSKSREQRAWLKEYRIPLTWRAERWTTFHLIAFCGLASVIDFALADLQRSNPAEQSGPCVPVRFDNVSFEDDEIPTPLEIAAIHGHTEVVTSLLQKGVQNMLIRDDVLKAAARNEEQGAEILSLLLRHGTYSTTLSTSVVQAAAENSGCGSGVMTVILDTFPDLEISVDLLLSTARNRGCGGQIMRLFVNRRGSSIKISNAVIEAAIHNRGNGGATMAVLLDHVGATLPLNQGLVEDICRRLDVSIFRLLPKDIEIRLTEESVGAALVNPACAEEMLLALLERCNCWELSAQRCFEKICRLSYLVSTDVIDLLYEKHGHEIMITEEVVETITNNGKIMKKLLDESHMPVDQNVAAAICRRFDTDTVCTLLDQHSHIKINEAIVEAASWNVTDPKGLIMAMLQHSERLELSEEFVNVIWECFDVEVVRLFLRQQSEFRIPRRLVFLTAISGDRELMLALLEHNGGVDMTPELEIMLYKWYDAGVVETFIKHFGVPQITDAMIEAAAANRMCSNEVMRVLLASALPASVNSRLMPRICRHFNASVVDQVPDMVISGEVIDSASWNTLYGREVVLLLLTKSDRDRRLTAEAVAGVCQHFAWDREVFALLRKLKNPRGYVTKGMLISSQGVVLLENGDDALCTEYGTGGATYDRVDMNAAIQVPQDLGRSKVTVTVAMLEEAATDELSGSKILEKLLESAGECDSISEQVVRAAVSNVLEGEALIELLIHRYPHQSFLTDGILQSAIANNECGENIIARLLRHHASAEIHITPGIIWAVAAADTEATLAIILNSSPARVQVHQSAFEVSCQLLSPDIISLLLSDNGHCVHITEKAVEAAAGNCMHGSGVLRFLFHRDRCVRVTETALQVAAASDERAIMALLLNQRGPQKSISEVVVCAAAGNQWGTSEVMAFLLDQYDIPITENVLIAAAVHGRDGIALLLRRQHRSVNITDAVLQAAKCNKYHGDYVWEMLHAYKNTHPQSDSCIVM